MKKLTLLLAGLAMEFSSVFAITPMAGTNTLEMTVPDDWKNVAVGNTYVGWFGTDLAEDLSSFQYCKVNITGNILSVRFFIADHIYWIMNGEGTKTDETAYTKEELMNVTNADVWFKINNPEGASFGFHCGDDDDGVGSVTVNSVTFYGECEDSDITNYKWESQDGSVKLSKINVDGNVTDDLTKPNPVYWYDTYAKAWKDDYPAINQNFTFAIEAKDDATKAFCDYTGAGEAISTFGIHIWDSNAGSDLEQSGDFRLERIGSSYVYGVDMNASALKGSQGGAFQPGVCGADASLAEIWFVATIAFIGDESDAGEAWAWWTVFTAYKNLNFKTALPVADVMPDIEEEWADMIGCTLIGGIAPYGSTDGYTIGVKANGCDLYEFMYGYGNQVVITAVPEEGYHFTQWNDGNTQNPRTITVTGNATYVAQFAQDGYTITATPNNGLYGTVSGGGTYDYNSKATLTATPNFGYKFVQWNDGCTDNPRVVKLSQDTTFKAIFQAYTDSELENAILHDNIQGMLRGNFDAYPRYCPFWLYVYTVQASTDELAIPVSGQQRNWLDQGIYIQMMQHNWTADNPVFESCWKYCYNIISGCNVNFGYTEVSAENKAKLRLLRAYAYYRLMDLFGSVPIVTEHTRTRPVDSSRSEVFAFVESELNDAVMQNLPIREYGGMDKGVSHTLKARLYLNSKVFLGLEDGSDEYNAYLEKCIAECDSVINSGQYSIAPNIYSNFYFDNGPASSPENIFVIQYNNDGSTLGNRTQMTSYYKTQDATFGAEMYQYAIGGWKLNPGKTADDPNATFNIFSKYDNRRLSILWGQQYDRKTKQPIKEQGRMYDKDKNIVNNPPINYTPFFDRGMDEGASAALEKCAFNGDGARIIKFELEADPQDFESGVDMVVMRYAEVLYMKAEALIRLGRGTEAIPLFKEVLQHRGYDYDNLESFATTIEGESVKYDFTKDEGKDATWACALMSKRWLDGHTGDIQDYDENFEITADLEFMDQELRREFIWEDHRRTDMIRMGKFITGTWGGHLTPTLDKSKEVFPQPINNEVPICGIRIDVAVNNSEMGGVSGGGYYEYNTTATLTAMPKMGYKFVQWSDGNKENPRQIVVMSDMTYTAIFEEDADGIREITAAGINIYTEGKTIIVENATDAITVSDALGRVVGKDDAYIVPAETRKFPVPSSGVYVVKIGNRAASVLVR